MTIIDFGHSVRAQLGPSRPTDRDEAREAAEWHLREVHAEIETTFSRAGFYGRDADPYFAPETPWNAPQPPTRPKVEATRELWIGHWNPSDKRFHDGTTAWSDINDPMLFPWRHPEAAVSAGWWISTEGQKGSRLYAGPGDLVVVQRQRPKKSDRTADPVDSDNMYVGLAGVLATVSWLDSHTGRYESQACLVPLCHFVHPVSITTAKQHGRLGDTAFSSLPAKQDLTGLCFGISAVPPDTAAELLSVCGLSPEILAEPHLATIAGRLAATPTGNEEYLKLRYDHHVRQAARKANELRAEDAAKDWARLRGYLFVSRDAPFGGLGYDLLFVDGNGRELQIEAKGYSASSISSVNLQPSQERRAREAAGGQPPDWRLYVLLRVSTKKPKAQVYLPHEVLDLIDSGTIAVNR